MRAARLLAVAVAVAALAAGVAGQSGGVTIVTPTAETVVTGPTVFAADVTAPGQRLVEVVFYVDGQRACTAAAGRSGCQWDAGPRVASRHVRAVARLGDGSQLSAAIRTKELDISQHASVEAVVVSVHVTDSRDRFVRGLGVDDFRLFEDGRPQTISSVTAEDAPADIVLTLDISGSMAPVLNELKASARRFVDAVRPQDRLTVAGFNTGLFVISPAGVEAATRAAQLERVRAFGRTSLYDSIVRAADLYRTPQGRRALVVMTDGDDIASRGSPDTARAALQAKDIVLYVAGQGRAADDDDLRDRLRRMAQETGGAAFFAGKMSALDEQFADVLRDIGNQYVLTYAPDRPMGDGAWRALKVETVKGRHDVRARQGYFANPSTDQR